MQKIPSLSRPLLVCLLLLCPLVVAQEQLEKPAYVALRPAFVTNYGDDGKIHYLKVEMTVRVESLDHMHTVEHHMPYLRNNLIMLLRAQTNTDVNTPDGREAIRAAALLAVQQVLEAEEGNTLVTDLLFDNFIVQS